MEREGRGRKDDGGWESEESLKSRYSVQYAHSLKHQSLVVVLNWIDT